MSRLSSCNQFSGYINAVNLYSIGYCWPTLDRPSLAVEWFYELSYRRPNFYIITVTEHGPKNRQDRMLFSRHSCHKNTI